MGIDMIEISKALSNETRLNILKWLKDPEGNFPPQGGCLSEPVDLKGGVWAKDNAAVVSSGDKPEVPMLMFVFTGKGDQWREVSYRFAENHPNIKTIELDCDHYVFHYEADKMTKEIGLFLDDL